MAYIPNEWKDQVVQRPKTYQINNNDDGSVTLIDSFGLVTELGTPVNQDYMNHIEQGIAGCAIRYYSTTETFKDKEGVLNVNEVGEIELWQSLSDGNLGNPLTDDTKWRKVEKHFLNKNQITNCILEAPNGVATYSGSTLTIKAGLKVLIPNGRNADGTLKNIEYTLENDSTKTISSTYEHQSFVFIKNDGTCFTYGTESIAFYNKLADRPTPATNVFKCCFVDETNFWYVTSNGSPYEELKMAKIGICFNNASSQITKLNTDEPINLLKQSDKSQVSGWGMPSGNYIDLTLGANDSQYTAPANGWFVLTKRLGASAQLTTSVNSKFGFITYSNNTSNQLNQHTVPVKKGDTVTIHWSAAGSTTANDGIRFIYAQGEVE